MLSVEKFFASGFHSNQFKDNMCSNVDIGQDSAMENEILV